MNLTLTKVSIPIDSSVSHPQVVITFESDTPCNEDSAQSIISAFREIGFKTPSLTQKPLGLYELEQIAKLSKLSINKLRKLNPERSYNGKELTKYQLIFQIVFLKDAPNK